jgi:hypothetical protein
VGALAVVAVVAGCSTSAPPLSVQASQTLEAQVQGIRAAAVAHDRPLADSHLAQLRADVTQLQRQGQLSSARATAILAAATSVQAQLTAIPNPVPPTTLAPPTPPTQPSPPTPPTGPGGKDHGGKGGGGGGDGGH